MKMMHLFAAMTAATLLLSPLAAEESNEAQATEKCETAYDACLEQCEKAEDGSEQCYEKCEKTYDACLASAQNSDQ